MAKPKTKDWKRKTFSLDVDAAIKIKELARFEGMTETEFIEFLAFNWDSGINPQERLNKLLSKRKELVSQMNDMEKEIKESSDQITLFNEWGKQKILKRNNAIEILESMIKKKDFEKAEAVSRIWQKMTGIPSVELLMEAKGNVERAGT